MVELLGIQSLDLSIYYIKFKNFVRNTLHIDTLILPAIILKIFFLHDLSLRAAWAGHWLLGQLKEHPERQIGEGDNFQNKGSTIQCIYM